MRWQNHIVAMADALHGWPRFRNTRILVAVVLDNLAAGVSAEELLADNGKLRYHQDLAGLQSLKPKIRSQNSERNLILTSESDF